MYCPCTDPVIIVLYYSYRAIPAMSYQLSATPIVKYKLLHPGLIFQSWVMCKFTGVLHANLVNPGCKQFGNILSIEKCFHSHAKIDKLQQHSEIY